MSTHTPVPVLEDAHYALLKGDGPLAAVLVGGEVYNGDVPQGAPLPYIKIGSHAEFPHPEQPFESWIRNCSVNYEIYASNKKMVTTIYAHLCRLLNDTSYAVTGWSVQDSDIRLILTAKAPEFEGIMGVATCDVRLERE